MSEFRSFRTRAMDVDVIKRIKGLAVEYGLTNAEVIELALAAFDPIRLGTELEEPMEGSHVQADSVGNFYSKGGSYFDVRVGGHEGLMVLSQTMQWSKRDPERNPDGQEYRALIGVESHWSLVFDEAGVDIGLRPGMPVSVVLDGTTYWVVLDRAAALKAERLD